MYQATKDLFGFTSDEVATGAVSEVTVKPFKTQLLKWVGNKQRFAHEIISYFPNFNKYIEPFLGSGAVLGTLQPKNAIASDVFEPLIEIWKNLQSNPDLIIKWYKDRYDLISEGNKIQIYDSVLSSYNKNPNGADFLFLTRTCYGGVVRFRKNDGYMSTPCGVHSPMPPEKFASRVKEWNYRTKNSEFICHDYKKSFDMASAGDLIYCDPPYSHSQAILYGAQSFSLQELFDKILWAKNKGVFVVLSIDGSKTTENILLELNIPKNLFTREAYVNCGRSMLKRFQMEGESLEDHMVTDRLLLTY
ncbi:MAG: Dam family site-specific DNA-(adenine-N6)-methyltransferase [Flavobacteriaceae bacterium]|jgi:DNA adenine methylase|nr:Dam family site-specific DNA-(adenine-N6)-methyltransferase [Flavobacteriaceae bacterium]